MEALIRVCGVHYAYESGALEPIDALRGIDLTIARGEWLAIIGHNGSGKSTLAKCLNGLLRPTQGEVWVDGRDTRDPAALLEIRRSVGIVLQNPDNQFVASSVQEEVAFGPENLGHPRAELRARVDAILQETGLAGRALVSPGDLSAGEKSRLAMAGILAMRPSCLVLDESTAYLDGLGRAELLALVQHRHAQGLTVLTVTHYLDEALLADRIVVLRDGQVALDFAPHAIAAQRPTLEALGFELPAIPRIAEGLRARGLALPAGIIGRDELEGALRPLQQATQRTAHEPMGGSAALPDTLPQVQKPAGGSARDPILSIHDLAHTYLPGTPLARVALRDATLELARGEIHALVGASGAGKTTLVRFCSALIRPIERGHVQLLGRDAADPALDMADLRRRVGLVFQYAHQQLVERYVGDDVALGPRQLGLPLDELRRRVTWALEQAGLPPERFLDRLTFALSGGEMRRVALAGVLAMQPEVLILDEATAGLDPRGRVELHALLRARRAEGATTLLVSNDMAEVAALADRVTVLVAGVTHASGPAREVLADVALLAACGLAAPAASQLCATLGRTGLSVEGKPITPDEAEEAIWQASTR